MNDIKTILSRVIETDYRLTVDDAALLFSCKDNPGINMIKETANQLRKDVNGDKVSYIINQNVNFTNVCDSYCLFCGFRKSENEPDSYTITTDELYEKLLAASKSGAMEVCYQGGLYSKLQIPGLKNKSLLGTYAELLEWTKEKFPNIHIHSYSPEEIDFLSLISGKSINYVLEYFKDSGLDSMPGTAAEILVDEVRKIICPKKLNTKRWVEVITQAHKTGIPSTATILFGHVETDYHRAQHLGVLRDIQDKTGGFTEYIPLPFVPKKTVLNDRITPLTSVDRLKMLAIARLFFKGSINNIQASWVKQGMEETAESLDWGVNDVGGTLGDERITLAAGGNFGRSVTKEELIDLISSKDREPVLRDTLYNYIKEPLSTVK